MLLVDLPGHRRSALPPGRLTVEAMAARVEALLDELGEGRVHVVGISLGACAGLALTLRAPARVRSLTLVNGFARLRPPDAAGELRMAVRLVLLATAPMTAVARLVAAFDARARLGEIRCPTLVVAGLDDRTVALEAKEALAHGIPGARFVLVPGSGHATPVDRADAFNGVLHEFLATASCRCPRCSSRRSRRARVSEIGH